MDPCKVTRLVERKAVVWGREGLYIVQSGRCTDLLVSSGGRDLPRMVSLTCGLANGLT
jgi:hypothetical protein